MDYIIIGSLLMILLLLTKDIYKRLILNKRMEEVALSSIEREKIYVEEIMRRENQINNVQNFLKHAIFLKPFAVMGAEKIFTYIMSENRMYEFSDFMPEKNQRFGIDDDLLCFNKCMYIRVGEEEKVVNILEEVSRKNIKPERVEMDFSFYLEKLARTKTAYN